LTLGVPNIILFTNGLTGVNLTNSSICQDNVGILTFGIDCTSPPHTSVSLNKAEK